MSYEGEKVPVRRDIKLAPDPARISDAALVAQVRASGLGSVEYRYLEQALQEVAVGTLTNLEKKNKLHSAILNKGCRLCRPVPLSYPENFCTILHLAVWTVSPKFMTNQVMGGGWQAAGAASVRTFFVSAAMLGFAAEYNRFWHEEFARSENVTIGLDEPASEEAYCMAARLGLDPEETAVARDRLATIVNDYLLAPGVDPRLQTMVVRTAQQYTQAEIADELGLTADAVSSAIRRLRRRIS
ncbi:MAG: hypothetical protein ACRDRK_26975 [Pseudonocardia sp.]